MRFSSKTFILIGFITIFGLTRLTNLKILPIFVDEGIHLQWAIKMVENGQWLGITDVGKYLPIWIYALFVTKVGDPLWFARSFSILSGLFCAMGLIGLGKVLYDEKIGFGAALLYLILPFTLFHDRMALVDTFLTMLMVYTLLFSVRWVQTGFWGWGVGVGLMIGAAAITKLYGVILLIVPLVVIIFWRGIDKKRFLLSLLWIYGLVALIMLPNFIEWPQHIGRVSSKLSVSNEHRAFLYILWDNFWLVIGWGDSYLTGLGLFLVGVAFISGVLEHQAADLILITVSLIWLVIFVASGGNWYPRYLLPAIPPLLLLIAQHSFILLKRLALWLHKPRLEPVFQGILLLILMGLAFPFNYYLLTNPVLAPWPQIERWQYIEGEHSGYQLTQVVDYFRQMVAETDQQLIIVRDRDSGPLQEGLNLSLDREAEIILSNVDLGSLDFEQVKQSLMAQPNPVYFVVEQSIDRPDPLFDPQEQIELDSLATFPKPGNRFQFEVYQVKLRP